MEKLLRECIRELLKEAMEIVTITRNNDQFAYEMEFDSEGNILTSNPISGSKLSRDEIGMIEIAKNYSTVPIGTVLRKIRNLKAAGLEEQALQATATSHADVVKVLNDHWRDTLNWNPAHRKGRGEVQLHLAFKARKDIEEPDFVSADGNVLFSVKYVGTGSEAALTGESEASLRYTQDFSSKLARILEFSPTAYQKDFSGSTLLSMYEQGNLLSNTLSDQSKLEKIEQALSIVAKTKQAIFQEYGPKAKILMCDDKAGFYLIEQADQIGIRTIKKGTRLDISGPRTSAGRMDLEKALKIIENSIQIKVSGAPPPASPPPRARKGKVRKNRSQPVASGLNTD